MIPFLLVFLAYVSASLGQVIIKSNYPLRNNNLLNVLDEANYSRMLLLLKNVEDIKKVQAYKEGDNVIILIERFPTVKKIRVKGNLAIWDSEITSFLGIREGEPFREEDLDDLKTRLEEFYRGRGFLDVSVKVKLRVDSEGQAELNIEVNEGDLYFIGGVVFRGLKSFPKEDLLYRGGLKVGEIFREGKVGDSVFLMEKTLRNEGFIESFVFLKEIYKKKTKGSFKRVLYPSSGSHKEGFKDKLFSLFMGVNNLVTHPIATWKALLGRGKLAFPEYRVVEGRRYRFEFHGNKSFPGDKLLHLVKLERIFSIDIFSIGEINEAVKEFYKSKGFLDVEVETVLEDGNKVKVNINEGARYKLKYKGNYDELPEYYDARAIESAIKKIKDRLVSEGYAFPVVDKRELVDKDKKVVFLSIDVNRGKRFILAGVLLLGKEREISSILKSYTARLPAVYNSKIIESINRDIEVFFRDKGFLDGKYEADVKVEVSEEEIRYTYIYRVKKGKRYRYGETLIYGNDKTVKREIHYMLVGNEYYSERDVDESIWNLVLSGIFTSAKVDTFVDRDRKLVHRLVELREDSRGYFEGAVSYNTEEKFKIEMEVGLKNLLGVGISATTSYAKSQKYETYGLKFEDRFLFSRKFLTDLNLFKSVEFHNSYDLQSEGFSINLGYRWKPRAVVGVFFSSLRNKVFGFQEGKYDVRKYGIFLLYDERDNLLAPKKVFHTRFRASLSTGSRSYVKFESDSFLLRPLQFKEGVSITVRFAFGGVGKEAPVFDRFFLGGLRDMRGYEYEAIGFPQGGRFYYFLRGELIFPIFGGLKGVVFTDTGAVSNAFERLWKETKQDIGASLAIDVPVGLIRVDVAKPLEKVLKPTSNLKVYLSIGFVY